MNFIRRIDQFHQSRTGYFAFSAVELVLFYVAISIAINTASMWAYLAALILLIGTVQNIIHVFKRTQKPAKKGANGKR